jgi:hypothetical protein
MVVINIFAEFEWSAWGRGVFTPIAFSGEDSSVSAATATWQNDPRIGFTLTAAHESGNIGFEADFQWDGSVSNIIGDDAKVWVQPVDFLKLTVGKFNEDHLRGIIANTIFTSWLLPNGGKDEDGAFDRFQATAGAHIAFVPTKTLFNGILDGLYIEAAIGSNTGNAETLNTGGSRANRNLIGNSALDVYKAIQAGIGYRIPDIGFARAQFIGNNRQENKPNAGGALVETTLMQGLTKNRMADVIQIAFLFNRIKELNVEAGVKIPLEFTTDVVFEAYPPFNGLSPINNTRFDNMTVQLPFEAAVAATYSWNNFYILTRMDFAFGGKYEAQLQTIHFINQGLTMNAWVNPSYKIFNNFRAGIDMGMELHTLDTIENPEGYVFGIEGSNYLDFGIGPWAELILGGGTLRGGVMIMLPGSPRWSYKTGALDQTAGETERFKPAFTGDPVISIPISFTYSL